MRSEVHRAARDSRSSASPLEHATIVFLPAPPAAAGAAMLRAMAPRPLSVSRGVGSRPGVWGRRPCGGHSYIWEENKEEEGAGETSDNRVHPSAVVHPSASIGQGVSIGPFCTVGSSVRLGDGCQMHPGSHIFGNTELGEKCTLLTGAIVGAEIPGRTTVGRNNIVGYHSVIGAKCQDMKYVTGDECFLDIGDNNDIREYTSIHRSSKSSNKTVIGNNNLIMGSCHIAHDCKIGSNNIFSNNTLLAGHVVVEDYARSAGATVVHQFCHLGSHCFIGGGSVISQDVPRYMMVSGERAELRGLNSEGLRRFGFSCAEIQGIKRAYRRIFMPTEGSPESVEDRLTEVEQEGGMASIPAVLAMIKSIRDSFQPGRRGICKHTNWWAVR